MSALPGLPDSGLPDPDLPPDLIPEPLAELLSDVPPDLVSGLLSDLPRIPAAQVADLPTTGFAFPGALRDQLNAAILDGTKTSTSSLVLEYRLGDEPFPEPGRRVVVRDSDDRPLAVIETTEVRFARLGDVDLAHAVDEGEGYASVAEWRAGHESFWHSAEMRRYLLDPAFAVDDDTEALLERFKVIGIVVT